MRISVSITNYSWPAGPAALGAELARVARAADDAGLDTVWVADHLIQADPASVPDSEMLEAYATLGFLAAHTRRIRIGAMVSPVTFRPASLLIKAVTTLDVLSGGRAWLGLGAGYHDAEARQMGLPFPPARERFAQLEETLRLAQRMWSGDAAPRYNPLPLTTPHPPILVGGAGERRTLRLVARYADACNLFDIPDGGKTIRHKLDVLQRHCEAVGRPYEEIEKTVSTRLNPGEPAERFAERCAALAALGIEHAVVITSGPWSEDAVATLGAAQALSS
jgi:alkanesulfonate monooxygenase SsuD/methylene tetrahydromethanopterin reductase-like flavin-dependent oxidoreductase (luciferase family)